MNLVEVVGRFGERVDVGVDETLGSGVAKFGGDVGVIGRVSRRSPLGRIEYIELTKRRRRDLGRRFGGPRRAYFGTPTRSTNSRACSQREASNDSAMPQPCRRRAPVGPRSADAARTIVLSENLIAEVGRELRVRVGAVRNDEVTRRRRSGSGSASSLFAPSPPNTKNSPMPRVTVTSGPLSEPPELLTRDGTGGRVLVDDDGQLARIPRDTASRLPTDW